MMKFSRFVRGQVWYWEDPVYGAKSNRKLVPTDEETIRYSRPVLIVQDASTIDRSIMVAPLSTSFDENDYDSSRSIIFQNPAGIPSRIAVGSLMPVSPNTLSEYKYTFSESAMDEIMGKIALLLGINYYNNNSNHEIPQKQYYPYNTKNPFTGECKLPAGHVSEPTEMKGSEAVSQSNDVIETVKPAEEKPVAVSPEYNLDIKRTIKGRIIWTTELKKQFLEMCDKLGNQKTAEIFGIDKSTVGSSKYRFTAELSKIDSIDSEESDGITENNLGSEAVSQSNDVIETVKPAEEKPVAVSPEYKISIAYTPSEEEMYTKKLVSSISEFCNLMRRHANDNRLDTYISLYGSNEMIKDKHATETFYSKISASWYYALLKFFDIEEVSGSAIPIDIITESDPRYELATILNNLSDSRISAKSGTVKTLIDMHKKSYGNWNIPQDIIDDVRTLLSRKISMKERAFNRIIDIYTKLLGGNSNDN